MGDNPGLSTVHNFLTYFYASRSCILLQKMASVVAPSGFGERRVWLNVTSEKER